MSVRVRFAPSPTGSLHLGSARTALYNWLAARAAGPEGTFILRIEDTDRERSTPEHVDAALRIFRWLGLDWDEGPGVGGAHGPYFQGERASRYAAHARELLEAGHAYECYCTAEELATRREGHAASDRAWTYDGRCRDLSDAEREERRAAGTPASIRFRVPTGRSVTFQDLINGESSFESDLLGDFIIVRSSGDAVYNFACAVDDALMEVTHVIRGVDHLSNTPRQVLLLEAMGRPVPTYAHVPMILGPDGRKLSKRHGAASVEELDRAGYLPVGICNAVALLGCNRDDDTTVMSMEEMVEAFDPARVNKAAAAIDYRKLDWINGQHLRALEPAAFEAAWQAWADRWLDPQDPRNAGAASVDAATVRILVQEKVARFGEVPGLLAFLASDAAIAPEAWEKLDAVEPLPRVLAAASEVVTACADQDRWSPEAIEEGIRALVGSLEVKPRELFNPIRLAITGQRVSPGLFESAWALGAGTVRDRLEHVRTESMDRRGAASGSTDR